MRLIVCTSLLCALFFGAVAVTPVDARTSHVYLSGIVQYVGNNQIGIEAGSYELARNVTVVRLENHGNGVHYQRKGSLSDVRPGAKVYIKVLGRRVLQIEVER